MEHIVTFLPGQFPQEELFCVEMAGITYPDSRYQIEREQSSIYCLEYVIAGEGVVETRGKTYRPKQGDAYLLAAGRSHEYRSDALHPWEKIWMNVRGSLCAALVQAYGVEDTVLFPNCPLHGPFQEFLALCEDREARMEELFRRAPLLFHEIVQQMARNAGGTGEGKIPGPAAEIKAALDQRVYRTASMAELASAVSLSSSQLTRVFKNAYGRTPYDYLLTQKLETACLLLKNTGMPVKEIALRLCFSDEHYFSNLFKQKHGVSPGQYRKQG